MAARRFPPPWSVEDIGAAFVVKDSTGQKLAYVYYEDEPGGDQRPSHSPKMRRGGSRRISPSSPPTRPDLFPSSGTRKQLSVSKKQDFVRRTCKGTAEIRTDQYERAAPILDAKTKTEQHGESGSGERNEAECLKGRQWWMY
jgi:hypothetical protein